MTTSHTLAVPGAQLHYETRGSGPLLVLVGAPMSAAHFGPLADALAADHTVVTLDPRGVAGSRVDDPDQDSTPELRADDVAAILDALGAESADVFGSSGGAVTGLALVARHPERVRTLLAHEPPLLELLPDAAEQRALTEDIVETFRQHGQGAAWMKFMHNAGFDGDGSTDSAGADGDHGAPDPQPQPQFGEPSAQDIADGNHFFAHELLGTTRYLPDVAALTAGAARVVVGVGADSDALITYRTSAALADLIGAPTVEFPGDHGGFLGLPREFAAVLDRVLAGAGHTVSH
jgi:pimeloyl-ACP methyl ester carboxylesterase